MKILILLTTAFSSILASNILNVGTFNIENLEFDLDHALVDEFLEQYENGDDAGITAIVNEFADKIFKNIEEFAKNNNLDPLPLDDVEEENDSGSITLTNGTLNGISTIDRADDVTVSYSSTNKLLELYFPIMFSNLSFTYDYHVIIVLIGPKGNFTGTITDLTMKIKLLFDFNTYHAAVESVETSNKGRVSLVFHGNGVVDVVVNVLTAFVTGILQPVVAVLIEGVVINVADLVVNAINDFIDSVLYPTTAVLTTIQ